MILWIWTRNDATGLLDDEFKDGDVFQTKPDSFEPSIGAQEKKSFLIVKIPDPPAMPTVAAELVRPEYAPGASPEEPVVRRKCRYRLDWRNKFNAEETALIENATTVLPDGATVGGGAVASGVVSSLFTITDFIRK